MNKILIGLGFLVVLGVGGYFYYSNQTAYSVTPAPIGDVSSTTTSTTGTPDMKTYTMADVSAHGQTSGCWTAINGSVYDLNAWISKHPGGEKAILSICGKDGSAAFNGKHGGQMKPEAVLAGFKLGELAQ